MKKNVVKRIYVPVTKDIAVASDAALVNGKESNLPLGPGEYELESIEDLKRLGYPIDESRSLLSGRKGQIEKGQFEFRLLLPDEKEDVEGVMTFKYPEKGVVKIGVADGSLVLDGSGSESVAGLEVSGGDFGPDTLGVLAQLAKEGTYLLIEAIYLDADDDVHYNSKMVERHWNHDGTSDKEQNIFYPKASPNDNQTTIRSITNLGTYLTGAGYLEMPIRRGVGVNVTIHTEYLRK